ncbi:heat shock factor-type transcription factor, partial [Mucor lusitanicus CBS 277.49]
MVTHCCFRMLENKAFKDTFCWNDKGTTFIVKDTNEFSRTILPKHFKHCNFASFVRQLNKYDFHKVRNGDDGQKAWEFVHPKFMRDRRDLLEDIKRKAP